MPIVIGITSIAPVIWSCHAEVDPLQSAQNSRQQDQSCQDGVLKQTHLTLIEIKVSKHLLVAGSCLEYAIITNISDSC